MAARSRFAFVLSAFIVALACVGSSRALAQEEVDEPAADEELPADGVTIEVDSPVAEAPGQRTALGSWRRFRSKPSFALGWHLEHVDGDFQAAANVYDALYSDCAVDAPYERNHAAIRAAYRAGCAFEKAGNLRRARLAYEWLRRRHERVAHLSPGRRSTGQRSTGGRSVGSRSDARLPLYRASSRERGWLPTAMPAASEIVERALLRLTVLEVRREALAAGQGSPLEFPGERAVESRPSGGRDVAGSETVTEGAVAIESGEIGIGEAPVDGGGVEAALPEGLGTADLELIEIVEGLENELDVLELWRSRLEAELATRREVGESVRSLITALAHGGIELRFDPISAAEELFDSGRVLELLSARWGVEDSPSSTRSAPGKDASGVDESLRAAVMARLLERGLVAARSGFFESADWELVKARAANVEGTRVDELRQRLGSLAGIRRRSSAEGPAADPSPGLERGDGGESLAREYAAERQQAFDDHVRTRLRRAVRRALVEASSERRAGRRVKILERARRRLALSELRLTEDAELAGLQERVRLAIESAFREAQHASTGVRTAVRFFRVARALQQVDGQLAQALVGLVDSEAERVLWDRRPDRRTGLSVSAVVLQQYDIWTRRSRASNQTYGAGEVRRVLIRWFPSLEVLEGGEGN